MIDNACTPKRPSSTFDKCHSHIWKTILSEQIVFQTDTSWILKTSAFRIGNLHSKNGSELGKNDGGRPSSPQPSSPHLPAPNVPRRSLCAPAFDARIEARIVAQGLLALGLHTSPSKDGMFEQGTFEGFSASVGRF